MTLAASSAAFAGDKNMKMKTSSDAASWTDSNMIKSETMSEARMMDAASAATPAATFANDTIGEVLQADGQPDTQNDFELLTHDGDMLTKAEALTMDSDNRIADNAIVVPSSTGALTTVNCPIGTTAQPDMTCHVTGNFSLERTEALRKQEMAEDSQVLGATEVYSEMSVTKTGDMNWDNKYDPNKEYLGTLRPDSFK
jgi:hypothetical protein